MVLFGVAIIKIQSNKKASGVYSEGLLLYEIQKSFSPNQSACAQYGSICKA